MERPAALAHDAIHETVEALLRDEPRGRVLDVPAGYGVLSYRLQELGFTVDCCDLYPEIFQLEGVEIRKGDLDAKLPYEDEAFDIVICVEGLEHIENPANAIREFSRLVKTGGTLVASVPNIMNIEERFRWLFSGYTSHFKPLSKPAAREIETEFPGMAEIALHVNPIGYSELRFLLEKYGFEISGVSIDKPKRNMWAYLPFAWLIRLVAKLTSAEKRAKRWQAELNSDEVLLGGNTLIMVARKL
jgi:SAM-dependent methyltransferase